MAAQVQPQPPLSGQAGNGTPGWDGNQLPSTSLYVGDLDVSVTDAQLYDLFSQTLPRGGRVYRYPHGRNTPGVPMPGGMLSVPCDMGSPIKDAGISQPLPIGALASALANATPEQQRMMLGESLYPLVEQLEHDHAAKITGMLLEMDQTVSPAFTGAPSSSESKG